MRSFLRTLLGTSRTDSRQAAEPDHRSGSSRVGELQDEIFERIARLERSASTDIGERLKLVERIERLERERAEREAEHAVMIDGLHRLYKRWVQRMVRAGQGLGEEDEPPEPEPRESPLEMRRRLGR